MGPSPIDLRPPTRQPGPLVQPNLGHPAMSASRSRCLLGLVSCTVAALTPGCGTEPPRLADLELISGNGQTGLVGSSLPIPLEVEGEDEDGNPIEGLALRFEVTAGGGQVRPAEVRTKHERPG